MQKSINNDVKSKSYSDWRRDVSILHEDAKQAAWRIGYIKAEIKNDDTNRALSDSLSGRALWVAHFAIEEALIMFCARAWDKINDGISLRQCMDRMPSLSEIISGQVIHRFAEPGAHTEDKTRSRYDIFAKAYGKAITHPAHPHVNAMRNERFAHRLYECRDRIKFEGEIEPATLNQLVELATETIALINLLGLLCDSTAIDHVERSGRSEGYCRTFWKVMPRLVDIENQS